MDNLVYFPLRRICALGIPREALAAMHDELPFVSIESEGSALQQCDLLVIDENDRGALELVRWVRKRVPHFPVVFWSAPVQLAEHCRRLLFPSGPFAV